MAADNWLRRVSELLVPRVNFSQPYPCPECCGERGDVVCIDCSDGTFFSRYQLVITDCIDSTTTCDEMNGTWIVDQDCVEASGFMLGNCCRTHVLDPQIPGCGFQTVAYLHMWIGVMLSPDNRRFVGARFLDTNTLGIGPLYRKYYTEDPIDETENGNGSCDFDGITLPPVLGSRNGDAERCVITRV